jgi:putative membrane protein
MAAPPEKTEVEDIPPSGAPYTVFSGFCMGTADVVPGVSGGTMAVALGIYKQLIAAITSINVDALKALLRGKIGKVFQTVHWRFLVSLMAGVALGIGLMVKVVKLPHMVTANAPQRPAVYAVFFGMVLASSWTLGRGVNGWPTKRWVATAIGAVVGFLIVSQVPVSTPEHPLSGSFILLILGKYAYVLGALGKLDLSVIVPFTLGCGVGLLTFSRFLHWLLTHWQDSVLAGLIGLMFGSLYRIWPYQNITEEIVRGKPRPLHAEPFLPATFGGEEVKLLVLALVGAAFVAGIEWYAVRRKMHEGQDRLHEAERNEHVATDV